MAVVLRSNTDLVYLPDHGFVGEEGALRVLGHLQFNTTRLDISHNLLGSGGVTTLIKGLAHVRQRFSSDTARVWSLKDMNLGVNTMGDEGLESILSWAKKDLGTAKVLVQGNDIKLEDHVDGIIHCLNSSRLTTLSLTNNPLNPDGLARFLSLLECPSLTELHLSTCRLPPSAADALVAFLKSPRSRGLEYLELNGNRLGVEGIEKIVNVVEEHHFGIVQVGVLANEEYQQSSNSDGELVRETPREGYDPGYESRQLHHLVHERLPELVFRNRFSTRRIRRAALRTIGPARILLNAIEPSDEDTTSRVMAEVTLVSDFTNGKTPAKSAFRILDLPPEVLNHIVRHCSQDPYAMSGSQYARLRTQASSREELARMVRMRKERLKGIFSREEKEIKEREIRDEWLKRGRWDKWEKG